MKKLILVALMFTACATTRLDYGNPAAKCPSPMSEDQAASGRVQCRAECASWARDMVIFDDECHCICTPAPTQSSPYKSPTPGRAIENQS